MKSLKSRLIVLGGVGLIFLGACSSGNQGSNSDSPTTSPTETEATSEAGQSDAAGKPQAGGQVVESGPYHLEFISESEDNGTHLDFYLQRGDNHEAVPNAKVTAQVQLPNGQQKSLPLTYDAEGKHYTAMLPDKAPGEYLVVMTSDINGEKVNGRFTFSQ